MIRPITAISLCLLGPPVFSQTVLEQELTSAANAAIAKWHDCVLANARRFAPGRDPVQAIAKIAARSCPNEKRRVADALTHPSEPRTNPIASAMADKFQEMFEQRAAEAILDERAKEGR
jgi:hypothetical protein